MGRASGVLQRGLQLSRSWWGTEVSQGGRGVQLCQGPFSVPSRLARSMQDPFPTSEPIKAVVFDLDGTLANSLEAIRAASNHALWTVARGEPFSLDDYALMAGSGNKVLMARVLAAADLRARGESSPVGRVLASNELDVDSERVRKAVAAKIAFEHEKESGGEVKVFAFPGARDVLRAVSGAGLQLAVLSNKTQESVSRTVGAIFPEFRFRTVVGARDGHPLKPDAKALLSVVRTLEVEPAEAVMVGDTSVDMKVACNAGTRSVGVTWGFRSEDELRDSGASRIAHTFAELGIILNCPVKDVDT